MAIEILTLSAAEMLSRTDAFHNVMQMRRAIRHVAAKLAALRYGTGLLPVYPTSALFSSDK